MGLFAKFRLQRRISEAEEVQRDIRARLDGLEDDVKRILETRRKDRARDMARLRWDGERSAPSPGGNPLSRADVISQRIREQRERGHRSLAELAGSPNSFNGEDSEEE